MSHKCVRNVILSSVFFLSCYLSPVSAQDTLQLKEVRISSYPLLHSDFNHTSSIEYIDEKKISASRYESLVPVVNGSPGVRMEERSPGSYRFSIRGSLLRSPFGVRNVKFYIDEFPLTDAGGNTYLNLIDKNSISNIEIYKGPDASFYGANTGGAVVLNCNTYDSSFTVNSCYSSYNTIGLGTGFNTRIKKYSGKQFISNYESDGYRDHSAMNRFVVFSKNKFDYTKKSSLSFLFFTSKIDYNTPGGLTLAQANADPSASRQASGNFAGAAEQDAGVYNQTYFFGASNESIIGENSNNFTSFSYTNTIFRNPFITNYEKRYEHTFSLRNIFKNHFYLNERKIQCSAGFELQQTNADVSNYGNYKGEIDTIQASDEIVYGQGVGFAGISAQLSQRFLAEISASMNGASVKFQSTLDSVDAFNKKNYDMQIMPRLALMYSATQQINFRIVMSKGYSLPTIAEIRPSTNVFSTSLKPEQGWNAEAGVRWRDKSGRASINLSGFYYRLEDAIVRRVDENDNEYFINAGGTEQPGVEASAYAEIIAPHADGFLRFLSLRTTYTHNKFTFSDYHVDENDYSGNNLTGVPANILASELFVELPRQIGLMFEHYYCGSLPLNDENSDYAYDYHIFNTSIEKELRLKSIKVKLSGGVRNIFDEFYSSGNDLNAAGKRYYNPSPGRNYFLALVIKII